jgi:exonuclease SbcC
MIHINEITLENFQTHKKTVIDFSPHFNVIVGPTRSGKSSLVRALDFLLYNNWYEDYQRFYSDAAVITVKLSNGKTIVRSKNSKINKITITDSTGKIQRFESFGFSLPEEVIEALGVIPIDIGTKDPILANVANQDDPLFLLYTTGTDKTKVLSRLSGLHWIDFALKDLNADRHSSTKSIQLLKDANEQLLEKLKIFKNLNNVRIQFTLEKERLSRLKKVDELYQKGKALTAKTTQWKNSYQEVQDLKKINFSVEKHRLENIIHVSEILQGLQDLNKKLEINNRSIDNLKTQLKLNLDIQKVTQLKITEEESKILICPTCKQEIKNGQESKCHST